MKSLLIGEGATVDEEIALRGALESDGVDRVIHMKTQYLGPDELLVAAKIAVPADTDLVDVARIIDNAESRIRTVVPQARIIYLEPDLDRGTQPPRTDTSSR